MFTSEAGDAIRKALASVCSSPPGPRPVAASKTAAVLADSRRWIAADCTGADDALSASLVSEEEALLCVCLLMICLPLELTPGKSYVCKFQKVQRSEKRNAEMKGRIRARQGGGQWGGSIVVFFFSTVMMKYGVSRSAA